MQYDYSLSMTFRLPTFLSFWGLLYMFNSFIEISPTMPRGLAKVLLITWCPSQLAKIGGPIQFFEVFSGAGNCSKHMWLIMLPVCVRHIFIGFESLRIEKTYLVVDFHILLRHKRGYKVASFDKDYASYRRESCMNFLKPSGFVFFE